MAEVTLKQITKKYENQAVIENLNLSVPDGSFTVLVGPSGCGKSTTLRMIAGLESITEGELQIGNEKVNHTPPGKRDVAMVFQNYALYPTMSVFDNIGFGLRNRGLSRVETKKQVEEIAEVVGLTDYLQRKPSHLSGGQRQRVALARAMVKKPKVFLMDEPLSNLDAKLRNQMRVELTSLHKQMGTTFIYVTHDQVEAMTMGDQIVVMNQGEIQQVASPIDLYSMPANLFVAQFIGSPPMNVVSMYNQPSCVIGFRPEKAAIDVFESLDTVAGKGLMLNGVLVSREILGSELLYYVETKDERVVVKGSTESIIEVGMNVRVSVDAKHLYFFDRATGTRIIGEKRKAMANSVIGGIA
ncbi:ABC transporter ATP-binding protein [Aneurinibacillus aneurinilyticus]|jgi:sn-glycerol 3-phosphate transport system ATP-binding protein|uniref:ABC transporter ATP-binding protein n=2 Tax=Aneurinibacillus aneurinilyticus TaxID=1391 RepID=A0A848D328_ANEAE|nr:ABC transporter ATP-binding protein [Aneurinibacillus aneurinilyticus]ERI09080.1 ABC transporter, ATP-binding protein [Aneurinibacillus aneurinilyticus ATCC 12856]MCI1693340.1 ABC transporter ATP-binding protein [Aneurinibacillus aneurinilyticus]MED0671415.1 ABC transporter ATP-binding protein [Aneurinibacillus aneurinilyticus]MED0707517.1 ABC transporter ATP-binding protein [Aneurinibacillus aneurinilyticus]MED0723885.1 ABC transporter ATP-binding protein [Aneurinibacillus aneurinilyticus]